jgi:hypothetical protein
MAGLAAHGHLSHGGLVAVGAGVVVFAQAGVVAGGAHLVPHHATSGPVPPFTGFAVFVAVHVEPLVFVWIEAGFHGLEPTIATIDEELTQRIVADHAFDSIRSDLVAKPERNELVVAACLACLGGLRAVLEAAGRHKRGIIEPGIRFALGETVMRTEPLRELIGMAFLAALRASVLSKGDLFVRHDERFSFGERNRRRNRQRCELFLRPQHPAEQGEESQTARRHDHTCFPR